MAVSTTIRTIAAILVGGSILPFQPVFAQVSIAPPPAIEPVEFDGFVNFTVPPTTIGYDFSVSSGGSFTLTHLGVIDPDFDGLIDPVEVGIWDSFGNIVNSVILPQSPPPSQLIRILRFRHFQPLLHSHQHLEAQVHISGLSSKPPKF